jgi:hypothetical protein
MEQTVEQMVAYLLAEIKAMQEKMDKKQGEMKAQMASFASKNRCQPRRNEINSKCFTREDGSLESRNEG